MIAEDISKSMNEVKSENSIGTLENTVDMSSFDVLGVLVYRDISGTNVTQVRIESLADTFEKEQRNFKAAEKKFLRPRFSPGYGDFELGVQSDIFRVLDCPRRIGLSLNKSLLMSPSKSVTAIIGISDRQAVCASGCNLCDKKDCAFKERG